MPNCPSCGTWNPDDKVVCWRCQAELPKPVVKTKRAQRRIAGLPISMWVLIVVIFAVFFLAQCFILPPAGPGG